MSQSQESFRKEGRKDKRTEGQKDGQTLIHRTLPATAGGPIKTKLKTIHWILHHGIRNGLIYFEIDITQH